MSTRLPLSASRAFIGLLLTVSPLKSKGADVFNDLRGSAIKGDVTSQHMLGLRYAGLSSTADRIEALAWLTLAAENGQIDKVLPQLRSALSPDELARAEKRSEELRAAIASRGDALVVSATPSPRASGMPPEIEAQYEQYREQVAAAQRDNDTLKVQLARAEENARTIEARWADASVSWETDRKALSQRLQETTAQVKTLTARVQEINQSLIQANTDKAAAKAKVVEATTTEKELGEKRGEVAELKQRLAELTGKLDGSATELSQAKARVTELEALRAQVDDLKGRLATVRSEYEKSKEDFGAAVAASRLELGTTVSKLQASQVQARALVDQLDQFGNTNKLLVAERTQLQNELNQVRSKLGKFDEQFAKVISENEVERVGLRKAVTDTKAQVAALQRELAALGEREKTALAAAEEAKGLAEKEKTARTALVAEMAEAREKTQFLLAQLESLTDGNHKLASEKQSAEKALSVVKSEYAALSGRYDELSGKADNLSREAAKLAAASEELKALRGNLSESEGKIQALTQRVTSLTTTSERADAEVQALQAKLAAADVSRGEMVSALAKAQLQLKDADGELSKTRAQLAVEIERATSANAALVAANDDLRKVRANLALETEQGSKAGASLAATSEELQKVRAALTSQKEVAEKSSTALAAANDDVKTLRGKISDSDGKIEALTQRVASLSASSERSDAEVQALQAKLAVIDGSKGEAVTALSKAQEQLKNADGELSKVRSQLAAEVARGTSANAALAASNDELKKVRAVLALETEQGSKTSASLAAANEELQKIRGEISSQKEFSDRSSSSLAAANQELQKTRAALASETEQGSKAGAALAAANGELQQLRANLVEAESKLHVLTERVADLGGQGDRASVAMKELQGRLAEVESAKAQREDELAGLKSANGILNGLLEGRNASLNTASTRIVSLESELAEARAGVEKGNTTYASLAASNRDLTTEVAALKSQLGDRDTLRADLDRSESQLASSAKELQAATARLAEIETLEKKLKAENTRLAGQVAEVSEARALAEKTLEGVTGSEVESAKALKEAKATLAALQNDLTIAKAKTTETAQTNQQLASSLAGLNDERIKLLAQIDAAKTGANAENERLRTALAKASQASAELQSSNAQLAELKQRAELADASLLAKNRELLSIQERLVQTDERLRSVTAELSRKTTADTAVAALQAEKRTAESLAEKHKVEIATLRLQVAALEKDSGRAATQSTLARTVAVEQAKRADRFRGENEQLRAQVARLQQTLATLSSAGPTGIQNVTTEVAQALPAPGALSSRVNKPAASSTNQTEPAVRNVPRRPSIAVTPVASTERPKVYEVMSGDTLGRIAQTVYGDEDRWVEIYEANRTLIRDPKVLWVGLRLTIP